jgi:hypothetical protein
VGAAPCPEHVGLLQAVADYGLASGLNDFRDPAALQLALEATVSGQLPISESPAPINGGRYAASTRKVPSNS